MIDYKVTLTSISVTLAISSFLMMLYDNTLLLGIYLILLAIFISLQK